ncbi:MAG: hypothetical protein OXB88_04365 [Bacteriovoracales bacterium]|nr:hypothetical protein [Bacteriovoracales bacterium]
MKTTTLITFLALGIFATAATAQVSPVETSNPYYDKTSDTKDILKHCSKYRIFEDGDFQAYCYHYPGNKTGSWYTIDLNNYIGNDLSSTKLVWSSYGFTDRYTYDSSGNLPKGLDTPTNHCETLSIAIYPSSIELQASCHSENTAGTATVSTSKSIGLRTNLKMPDDSYSDSGNLVPQNLTQ